MPVVDSGIDQSKLGDNKVVDTYPPDVEAVISQRGVNDYLTYIAKLLVDDPEVTVDIPAVNEHWDKYQEDITPPAFDKYYHNARLTLNDLSPYKIRFSFGEADVASPIVNEQADPDEPWSKIFPNPILDRKALDFCLGHFAVIKEKLPKLAQIIDPLRDGEVLQNIQKILEGSQPVSGEDFLMYLEVGNDISRFSEVLEIYTNLGLSSIKSAKEILGREFQSPDDFDLLWPPQYREIVKELSLVERMSMLAFMNRYALAPTIQLDPAPADVFQNDKLPQNEDVYGVISDFLSRHPDFINPELLAHTTGLPVDSISPLIIDSVRSSFMSDQECRQYLMAQNPDQYADVAVLLTDKGAVLCPKTERRMATEMGEGRAYVLRYLYPDGTNAVIATKFEEVTLGVCLSTTTPHFKLGGIYLPDTQTHEELVRLGEQSKQDYKVHRRIVDRNNQQIVHKWAFTRDTNSDEAIDYGQNLLKEQYSED